LELNEGDAPLHTLGPHPPRHGHDRAGRVDFAVFDEVRVVGEELGREGGRKGETEGGRDEGIVLGKQKQAKRGRERGGEGEKAVGGISGDSEM
jgi:hypothetical protein